MGKIKPYTIGERGNGACGSVTRRWHSLKKRIAELDVIFKRIYEDNISGKLSRDYEQEQEQLKAVVETLGREVKQQKRVKIREIEIVYNFIGAFDFEGAREQSQTAQDKNVAKAGAA